MTAPTLEAVKAVLKSHLEATETDPRTLSFSTLIDQISEAMHWDALNDDTTIEDELASNQDLWLEAFEACQNEADVLSRQSDRFHKNAYTIVYTDSENNVLTYTTIAEGEKQASAALEAEKAVPGVGKIHHVIRHHTPRVTVCLNNDVVESAYSDSPVELLHVYTDSNSLMRAVEHGESLMPDNIKEEHNTLKAHQALAFNRIEVEHLPAIAKTDHEYVNDEQRVDRFTNMIVKALDDS